MAKILVADDEEPVRAFVQRALELSGHEVTAVEDGGEALNAFDAGAYDLVLADIVMPVMDGIALALKLAQKNVDTPVLLMTGYPSEKHRARNLDTLIAGVLSKPFSLDEIKAAVKSALDARTA